MLNEREVGGDELCNNPTSNFTPVYGTLDYVKELHMEIRYLQY